MRFDGKRAIVTGAARGIGRAIAERLAAEGARVAVLDIDKSAAEGVLAKSNPDRHLGLACDVSDSKAVDAAFKTVAGRFGGLDILVNNAGLGRVPKDGSDELYGAMAERAAQQARGEEPTIFADQTMHMSDEGWARVIAINLTGTFYCIRAAIRLMAEGGHGGSIVSIASTGAASGEGPSHYVTSKAGIIGLTRSLARELAPRKIRVNAVNPGPTATPIMDGIPEVVIKGLEAGIPLGRMAKPAEIAAAVCFLAADEASYVTGSVLSVNGGSYFS